jgi:hypothetical protein
MKKKSCICKACGAEIRTGAKFCQYCGAKIEKPLYKKWWFWLIVVAVIGAIGSGGSETESEQIATTPTTTQATTNEPTTEPTTEPSTEATTEPVAEQETFSSEDASELVMTMIKLSVSDKFDYYTVEGDETGITLCVATEGVAEDVVAAKLSGYDENYEPWVEAKDNFAGLCSSIYDSAIEFGMKDPVITLSVLNDQNHDNVLLMIMNGAVVYDVMAE